MSYLCGACENASAAVVAKDDRADKSALCRFCYSLCAHPDLYSSFDPCPDTLPEGVGLQVRGEALWVTHRGSTYAVGIRCPTCQDLRTYRVVKRGQGLYLQRECRTCWKCTEDIIP